jgi:hypothetical protein
MEVGFFSAYWIVFRAVRTISWTTFRAVRTAASWLFLTSWTVFRAVRTVS